MTHKENSLCFIEKYYNCANYCIDAELLRRRALYEKLVAFFYGEWWEWRLLPYFE